MVFLKAVITANKSNNWFNALIRFEINILLSSEPELQVAGTPIVIYQKPYKNFTDSYLSKVLTYS